MLSSVVPVEAFSVSALDVSAGRNTSFLPKSSSQAFSSNRQSLVEHRG